MKICPRCKKELPETAFFRHSSQTDGLQKHCKVCQHIQVRVSQLKSQQNSREQLIAILRVFGPLSSAELARHLKLDTAHAASNIARYLADQGLLQAEKIGGVRIWSAAGVAEDYREFTPLPLKAVEAEHRSWLAAIKQRRVTLDAQRERV